MKSGSSRGNIANMEYMGKKVFSVTNRKSTPCTACTPGWVFVKLPA
jgi:hypothetical protein